MPTTDEFIMDFRKEEKPEGGVRVKEGTYKAKIGKCKVERSANKGTIGLVVPCILVGKKKVIRERLWLSPKCFHRFRELLEACSKPVPQGRADVRRIGRAVEGEEIYVKIVDDEDKDGQYATKSVVAFQGGFISPDDYEDDDSEEEDDDDLDGDNDDLDDDEDDLEEEAPKARKKTRAKSSRRKSSEVDEDEEDDDDGLDLDDFE